MGAERVMRRRHDIRAILADPTQKRRLLMGAASMLIAVGEDFRIEHAEAQERARRLYKNPT